MEGDHIANYRDYSIFAGFWYGVRGAFIVQFRTLHWNQEGKTVFGPGVYRPDPSEGMTAIADLPQPEMVPYSRHDKRNACPRCGHVA